LRRTTGDWVAGCRDLAKAHLHPSISKEQVYKEDSPLRLSLLSHPVQQTVLKESIEGALYVQGDHCNVLALYPRSFSVMGKCCSKVYCRALWEGAPMLRAKDLIGYSRPCDSSSHCSFKALSNAGQKRYRSLGSG
jgi:hypothetical protein